MSEHNLIRPKMNVKKDAKTVIAVLYANWYNKDGDIAVKEFHKMHEYILHLEAKVSNLEYKLKEK